MKTTVKLFLSIIFIVIISCFKENKQKMNDDLHDSPREIHAQLDSQIHKNSYKDTLKYPNIIDENNENDEFISTSLFQNWRGSYLLKQEGIIDGWGRESISFSELYLIKPDSCVFKSWLADENGKKYKENDNYQEIIGGIYATEKKDSIEFYTKIIVAGGNNSISPLLTLVKNKKNYSIYSLLTSPANNGIVKMEVIKRK